MILQRGDALDIAIFVVLVIQMVYNLYITIDIEPFIT